MYYELYALLPRVECRDRISRLQARLHLLEREFDAAPQPHRPCKTGTANPIERRQAQQKVPSQYGDQDQWLAALREVRWSILPKDTAVPLFRHPDAQPHFLIVHLFSGRRRSGGFHGCLAKWAESRNYLITILSMDTANSVAYGNLQTFLHFLGTPDCLLSEGPCGWHTRGHTLRNIQ